MTVKESIYKLKIIKLLEEEKLKKESKMNYEILIKRNGKLVNQNTRI